MNDILHANVFFLVSTVMFSAIAIAFIIAIVYAIKILREIRGLVALFRAEAEKIAGDIEETRKKMRNGAAYVGGIFSALAGLKRHRSAAGRKKDQAKKA